MEKDYILKQNMLLWSGKSLCQMAIRSFTVLLEKLLLSILLEWCE